MAQKFSSFLQPSHWLQIVLGPKLGEGEFSHVYEVESFQLIKDVANLETEEADQRIHMSEHKNYRETRKARYALKHVKEDYFLHHGAEDYVLAASDLTLEAELLASLQHPNIIKLRGITYSGVSGLEDGPRCVKHILFLEILLTSSTCLRYNMSSLIMHHFLIVATS